MVLNIATSGGTQELAGRSDSASVLCALVM